MNWEHSNRFLFSYNDLISTACSPKSVCEEPVNNANQPVKSSDSHFTKMNYSQHFQVKNVRGEQVVMTVRETLI